MTTDNASSRLVSLCVITEPVKIDGFVYNLHHYHHLIIHGDKRFYSSLCEGVLHIVAGVTRFRDGSSLVYGVVLLWINSGARRKPVAIKTTMVLAAISCE